MKKIDEIREKTFKARELKRRQEIREQRKLDARVAREWTAARKRAKQEFLPKALKQMDGVADGCGNRCRFFLPGGESFMVANSLATLLEEEGFSTSRIVSGAIDISW